MKEPFLSIHRMSFLPIRRTREPIKSEASPIFRSVKMTSRSPTIRRPFVLLPGSPTIIMIAPGFTGRFKIIRWPEPTIGRR